jgi:hypothetical protein
MDRPPEETRTMTRRHKRLTITSADLNGDFADTRQLEGDLRAVVRRALMRGCSDEVCLGALNVTMMETTFHALNAARRVSHDA